MNRFLQDMMEREELRFKTFCEERKLEYSMDENSPARQKAQQVYKDWQRAKDEEEKEYERQQREIQEKIRLAEYIASVKNIVPTIYRDADIKDFPEVLQPKIDKILNGSNALIFGDNGVGKTHLAWALAKALAEKGKRVVYINAQVLLFEIKIAPHPYKMIQERYGRGVDALIVDEDDKIFESKADFVYLNFMVNHRYEWEKQMIFLGNGNKAQFIDALGQSIYSRLRANNGMEIVLSGNDKRLK